MRGKLYREVSVDPALAGTTRVVERFLYLPQVLPVGDSPGDLLQWRWLEWARIRQHAASDEQAWPEALVFWEDVCWEN